MIENQGSLARVVDLSYNICALEASIEWLAAVLSRLLSDLLLRDSKRIEQKDSKQFS